MIRLVTSALAVAASLFLSPVAVAAPQATLTVTVPGAFLVSTAIAGNGQPYQCTAGFAVRDAMGAGVLTAGHCRRDPVNPAVLQRTPGGDRVIGAYVRDEVGAGSGFARWRDAALVRLDPAVTPAGIVGGLPVTRVADPAELSADPPPVLCKDGSRTGHSCGPVTAVNATTVSFRAWDDLGDSGAPVYLRLPDGTAAAVGILYGHSDDEQGRVIHATLVGPVLHDWGLVLG